MKLYLIRNPKKNKKLLFKLFVSFLILAHINLIATPYVYAAPRFKNEVLDIGIPVDKSVSPQKKALFNIALQTHSLVLEKLFLTRIVLQNYLFAFSNEKFSKNAQLPLSLLPLLSHPRFKTHLPLATEIENGGEKVSSEEEEKFLKRSVITAWEAFQYDLQLKKMDSEERSHLREKLLIREEVPCLLTEILGKDVYDGTCPKFRVKGGYETVNDHPNMENLEKQITANEQYRGMTLATFQLLETPFYSPIPFEEPMYLLYGLILAKAFNQNTQLFQYAPPRKMRARFFAYESYYQQFSIEKALEPASLKRVREAWVRGLNEALKINTQSITYLMDDLFYQNSYSEKEVDRVIEKLSFVAQYASLRQEILERQDASMSPVYIEALFQNLNQVFAEQEASFQSMQIFVFVISGVCLAVSLFSGPVGWVIAGAVATTVLSYAAVAAYNRYEKRSSEAAIIASFYYSDNLVPLISDEEFKDAIHLSEDSLQDFIIAGISAGLEPLFFVRMLTGAKRIYDGGWLLAKSHLRNILIREAPKGRVLPWFEQKVLRLKNPKLSRLNWKTITTGLCLWLTLDYYKGEEIPPYLGGDELLDFFNDPMNKALFLNKTSAALTLLQEYDSSHNSQLFSLYSADRENVSHNFIGITQAFWTIPKYGKFYIPQEIIEKGTALNIVYEVAKATYLVIFGTSSESENNFENFEHNQELLTQQAHEFALECGGMPW